MLLRILLVQGKSKHEPEGGGVGRDQPDAKADEESRDAEPEDPRRSGAQRAHLGMTDP